MRTFEPFYSSVHFDVFIEVGPLGEGELAVLVGALVGPFVGVNPEVVEEVVPFAEGFSASLVIALEHLYEALRLRVLKSKNPELLGGRHVFLDVH